MERKEFLSLLGLTATALVCGPLFGCNANDQVTAPPANIDFTLDLTNAQNSALKSAGGYLYNNGIIVAHTVKGDYVAVSSTCTHAGGTVQYVPGGNDFYCPNHGSNFSTTGTVINGPASTSLTKYNTSLNGNSLRVYS
jgi:cytochrome b6-f complex iron-sulfur subunit